MSLFLYSDVKLIHRKLNFMHYPPLFTEFQSASQRHNYDDFRKVTSLRWNSEACKNTNFHRSYLWKYSEIRYEIRKMLHQDFSQVGFLFHHLKLCRKKFIAKTPQWPIFSSKSLTWGGYEGHNLYKCLGWEGLQQVNVGGIFGV